MNITFRNANVHIPGHGRIAVRPTANVESGTPPQTVLIPYRDKAEGCRALGIEDLLGDDDFTLFIEVGRSHDGLDQENRIDVLLESSLDGGAWQPAATRPPFAGPLQPVLSTATAASGPGCILAIVRPRDTGRCHRREVAVEKGDGQQVRIRLRVDFVGNHPCGTELQVTGIPGISPGRGA